MVALAHIEKYIADHPKDFPNGAGDLLKKARESAMSGSPGIILAGDVEGLLGKTHAGEIFSLINTDIEYLRISANAFQRRNDVLN